SKYSPMSCGSRAWRHSRAARAAGWSCAAHGSEAASAAAIRQARTTTRVMKSALFKSAPSVSLPSWIDDIALTPLRRDLPDVLSQEFQRARARELRALGVVGAALVAVEAVTGRIHEGLRARVLRRGLLRGVDRDRLIGLA